MLDALRLLRKAIFTAYDISTMVFNDGVCQSFYSSTKQYYHTI